MAQSAGSERQSSTRQDDRILKLEWDGSRIALDAESQSHKGERRGVTARTASHPHAERARTTVAHCHAHKTLLGTQLAQQKQIR